MDTINNMHINKINSFEYNRVFDDRVFMTFYIPINFKQLLGLTDYSSLMNQIIEFHYYFNEISIKYSICQMVGTENEIKMLDFCESKTKENFENNLLSIFPHQFIQFKTKVAYYHDNKLQYRFIENIMNPYSSNLGVIPAIDIITSVYKSVHTEGGFDEAFPFPLEFKIIINTDLFFNKFKYSYLKSKEYNRDNNFDTINVPIDNSEIGNFNAARFNSFIFDIKNIWLNKFQWKFSFDGNEKYKDEKQISGFPDDLDYCINGIPIDGKISFYEEKLQKLLNSIAKDDK